MEGKKYVDYDTGEIISEKDIKEKLKEEIAEEYADKKNKEIKATETRKSKDEYYKYLSDNLGSFHFCKYENIHKTIGNDSALMFRFVYLCTYSDYDGVLRFGNEQRGKHRDLMTESDFKEVFGLSSTSTNDLKKHLFDYGLIEKRDDKLIVNNKYFNKGKIDKNSVKSSVRVFEDTIQKLYKNVSVKKHSQIGILFMLLPLVSYHNNIICKYPNAPTIRESQPMTIQEICNYVGYRKSNASRLKKILYDIRINNEMIFMSIEAKTKKGKIVICFVVNPYIYYKGNDKDQFIHTHDYFVALDNIE